MRISCFTIPHSGGPQASWSHISVFRCQTFDWLWDIWLTLDGCLNSLVALVVAFRIVEPKWGYVFQAAVQSPNSLVVLVIAFRIVKPKWGYVFWDMLLSFHEVWKAYGLLVAMSFGRVGGKIFGSCTTLTLLCLRSTLLSFVHSHSNFLSSFYTFKKMIEYWNAFDFNAEDVSLDIIYSSHSSHYFWELLISKLNRQRTALELTIII